MVSIECLVAMVRGFAATCANLSDAASDVA